LQQSIARSGELDLRRLRVQSEQQITEYRELAEQLREELHEKTALATRYQ
jgi:hypothetical protein